MSRLIMVCGLPGTGKSTVAKFIQQKTNAKILRTDLIRKELFGQDPKYFVYGSPQTFPEKERDKVYKEMFDQATNLLKQGKNVILDGTFHKKELRDKIFNLAQDIGVKLEIIEVTCPEWLVKKGMTERVQKKAGTSTAGFDTHLKYKKIFEPIEREHLTIDASKDFETQLDSIL